MSPRLHVKVASRTFGRWHAIGPVLYLRPARWWLLHFYARWFLLPQQHGWHWGIMLWLGERGPHFYRGSRQGGERR